MSCDINCVFEGFEGIGAIYISGYYSAKNIQSLRRLNIGSVMTVTKDIFIEYPQDKIRDYLYVPIEESVNSSIFEYFDQTFQFLERNRKHTNILVHCSTGLTISPIIVTAYLVKKYNYSVDRVMALLKRRRKKINVNYIYLNELRQYCQNKKNFKENEFHLKQNISQLAKVSRFQKPKDNQIGKVFEIKRKPKQYYYSTNQIDRKKLFSIDETDEQNSFQQDDTKQSMTKLQTKNKTHNCCRTQTNSIHKESNLLIQKIERVKQAIALNKKLKYQQASIHFRDNAKQKNGIYNICISSATTTNKSKTYQYI